jgi:hypothetical protein
MKKPNGKPTPKALALRRWNCESIEEMRQLIETAEQVIVQEKWTQKYKSSINCSHPKGFSQKAHCAGKKKHNESIEMEMTCPDCGMCETHGDHLLEVKQRLDAKCWKGKHKEGTKIKGGVRVNNCVPNESIEENFADGKHPEDKGDSKRLGVPTKASVSTLRKLAHQGGRKGQLAHWLANMKAGRAKHNKELLERFLGNDHRLEQAMPYQVQSPNGRVAPIHD